MLPSWKRVKHLWVRSACSAVPRDTTKSVVAVTSWTRTPQDGTHPVTLLASSAASAALRAHGGPSMRNATCSSLEKTVRRYLM